MATADTARPLTETEERNLRAVTDVLEFWNVQDVEGIVAFYDEEIVWRNVAMEETYEGKDGVRAFLTRLFTAVPDLQFEVTHKIAHGDNVAEKWAISGTHERALFGVPGTGRRFTLPAMSMVLMRDGKFLRDDFYFDSGVFLRQVGLMPDVQTFEKVIPQAFLKAVVKSQRGLRKLRRR